MAKQTAYSSNSHLPSQNTKHWKNASHDQWETINVLFFVVVLHIATNKWDFHLGLRKQQLWSGEETFMMFLQAFLLTEYRVHADTDVRSGSRRRLHRWWSSLGFRPRLLRRHYVRYSQWSFLGEHTHIKPGSIKDNRHIVANVVGWHSLKTALRTLNTLSTS